jgi:Zn-dependent protease
LFHFAGVNVFMHWSWFVVAVIQIQYRGSFLRNYSSMGWAVAEYLALFVIVLMHEFGHSLACRSVGGRAEQIILWPLGGVAYVDPPQRPGATLWSIAAGPLVNVGLVPLLTMLRLLARSQGWDDSQPDLYQFIDSVWWINTGLLIFNMLPIYPMDGGQILRSLLWFAIGRARSLMVATVIGLIAVVLLLVFAIRTTWLLIMAAFVLMNCWSGFQQARVLSRIASAPRRAGLACPKCKNAPPVGNFWVCGRCRTAFDMFGSGGVCPQCGTIFNVTRCIECGESATLAEYGEIHS